MLPDPRNPWLVQHTTEQLLRQRVFGLCQGYEDLNDHDRLRDDLALQTALDKLKPAASSPTLCRFENRADRAAAVAMQRHSGRAVHCFVQARAGRTGARLRRHRRSGPRQSGRASLQRLLRQLLLPAAVRVLRRAAAGRLPAPGEEGRGAACGGDSEAAGDATAPSVAGRAHHLPRRLRFLPPAAAVLVRAQLRALRRRHGARTAACWRSPSGGASKRRGPSPGPSNRNASSASSTTAPAAGPATAG